MVRARLDLTQEAHWRWTESLSMCLSSPRLLLERQLSLEWLGLFLGRSLVWWAASGAVAGLVAITPAAGFVGAIPSIIRGAGIM